MSGPQILTGDCRAVLPTLEAGSVQCCVTSPPYWGLRDFCIDGQLGLEETPAKYIEKMVAVFREVWRVLRDDGTLWLNLGDSYCGSPTGKQSNNEYVNGNKGDGAYARRVARMQTGDGIGPMNSIRDYNGLKTKDLCMMPARVAMALQTDGWYLRSDIIWHKPNPMPESVTDRPTKAHEYIFLLTKAERYYYDSDAIREPHTRDWSSGRCGGSLGPNGSKKMQLTENDPNFRNGHSQWERESYPEMNLAGRNKRTVWTIATQPYAEAHFATFPEDLVKPCILAGSKPADTVLDPFAGSGTVGKVALELGRRALLIELNPAYIELATDRTFVTPGFL